MSLWKWINTTTTSYIYLLKVYFETSTVTAWNLIYLPQSCQLGVQYNDKNKICSKFSHIIARNVPFTRLGIQNMHVNLHMYALHSRVNINRIPQRVTPWMPHWLNIIMWIVGCAFSKRLPKKECHCVLISHTKWHHVIRARAKFVLL